MSSLPVNNASSQYSGGLPPQDGSSAPSQTNTANYSGYSTQPGQYSTTPGYDATQPQKRALPPATGGSTGTDSSQYYSSPSNPADSSSYGDSQYDAKKPRTSDVGSSSDQQTTTLASGGVSSAVSSAQTGSTETTTSTSPAPASGVSSTSAPSSNSAQSSTPSAPASSIPSIPVPTTTTTTPGSVQPTSGGGIPMPTTTTTTPGPASTIPMPTTTTSAAQLSSSIPMPTTTAAGGHYGQPQVPPPHQAGYYQQYQQPPAQQQYSQMPQPKTTTTTPAYGAYQPYQSQAAVPPPQQYTAPAASTPLLPAAPAGYRYSTIVDDNPTGVITTTLEKMDDLHCMCRQPMADDEECVGCDSCHVWFHPHCVGLDGVPDVDKWFCPDCRGSAATGQINPHSNLKNIKIVRYHNRVLHIPKHFSLCDSCYQYFYDYSQNQRTTSATNQPVVQPPKTYCAPCISNSQQAPAYNMPAPQTMAQQRYY